MALDVDHVPITGRWLRHLPAGGHPLYRPAEPGDFRWQRGAVVEGLYLAADDATVWAEWYRWLAEVGRSPRSALPRDLWCFAVRLDRVADLTSAEALARAGLEAPTPSRQQWPVYQAVGERLHTDGWDGVLYAGAGRLGGRPGAPAAISVGDEHPGSAVALLILDALQRGVIAVPTVSSPTCTATRTWRAVASRFCSATATSPAGG